jgi:hypothetical protein
MSAELVEFVGRALEKGIARGDILRALKEAGWTEADIDVALGAFAEVNFPLPIPRPKPYLSAWETFIYLVVFAALYIAAYSLGALVFDLVDRVYPDALQGQGDDTYSSVRWNIASLVVSFPLFLLTFRIVTAAITHDPSKRASRPRKWLTYVTLFIATVTLITDLTTLVYNALGGELTIRFDLKVATVAIIAGGIFSYFLIEMKRDESA